MLEGYRHQPPGRRVAVGAVVLPAHAEAVAFQVADGDLEGLGAALGRRTWGPLPAASSDTLLGEEKQWSKACTRSLTRLPRCCQALSNPSPYSSWGSTPRTLRHSRSTVSTLTRLAPSSRHAAWTDRTSPWSALDPTNTSRSSTPCLAARVLRASSSGPAASLERGSARHSGAQRTSPVAGSRP